MKLLLGLSLLLSLAQLCPADTSPDGIPSVSLAPFPIKVLRTHVWPSKGTPADKAELETPFPSDFPPGVVLGFEPTRGRGGKSDRYFIPSRNILRVYNIAQVKTAPYETIRPHIEQVRTLLERKPTKPPNAGKKGESYNRNESLPDYPPRNAGHLLEAKLSYLDAVWGGGIFYIAQFVQGIGEVPNNEQLTYLFQGLSKDGKYFVSADFGITHTKVPQRLEDAPDGHAQAEALTDKIEATLQKEPDDSFTPSLRQIREWISTLKIE